MWMSPKSLISVAVLFCLFFILACKSSSEGRGKNDQKDIRKPAVAGQFYPGDPKELKTLVDDLLEAAKAVPIPGEIIALVSPHAGYAYSGAIAASAYKQVQGKRLDVVILIGPSHREGFPGSSVCNKDGFETPLGIVPIDKTVAKAISDADEAIHYSMTGHRAEHSLEVQLPFLQTAIPNLKIVPIVLCDFSLANCRRLANAIFRAIRGKKVLIVASSDLYHGYSYEKCIATDNRTLTAVEAFDPEKLSAGIESGTFQACGGGPILVAQMVAKKLGANKARVINRTNSGDVTGRKSGYIVGYGAVVIYRSDKAMGKIEFKPLDKQVQKELLKMARKAIEGYLDTGKIPKFEPKFEVMKEKRGVFVTITEHGMLRGCIGYHENDIPLYQLVPNRAVAAAFNDPRFPPLSKNELDDIKIKISVYLTNVYKIKDLSEFELGKHGIIMTKEGRGATFLPEVPIEAGWTKEEEMVHLCLKAGLPADAWRHGAELYVYETQVFAEEK